MKTILPLFFLICILARGETIKDNKKGEFKYTPKITYQNDLRENEGIFKYQFKIHRDWFYFNQTYFFYELTHLEMGKIGDHVFIIGHNMDFWDFEFGGSLEYVVMVNEKNPIIMNLSASKEF